MSSLLIIDDDVELGAMLCGYLESHEMRLDIRHTGDLGLKAAAATEYDLMLLDVMLPDLNGFEILRRLRAYSDVPVVLLTACCETTDRVRGLRLGADDYLPKPFDPDELVARIEAILRRRSFYPPRATATHADNSLNAGDFVIDIHSQAARYKGLLLNLTDIEFALLVAFVESPGVVLDREDLTLRIFDRPFHPLNRTLDMHVSRLRRKLRSATNLENPIKTIRSVGYQFSVNEMKRSRNIDLLPILPDQGLYDSFDSQDLPGLLDGS